MAQLVARLVRNEKVGGSNPPSSTTGRHPIVDVGFLHAGATCRGACCCVGRGAAGVPGAARAVLWAGLLGVPVGGCPPARRQRRELRSARRLVVRPGPATVHRHCGLAPPLPTGTSAWPCRRPPAPRPCPPVPPAPTGTAAGPFRACLQSRPTKPAAYADRLLRYG